MQSPPWHNSEVQDPSSQHDDSFGLMLDVFCSTFKKTLKQDVFI